MKWSPHNIIEIGYKVVKGRTYFHHFYVIGPCIEGFRSGCRPCLVLMLPHSMIVEWAFSFCNYRGWSQLDVSSCVWIYRL
jgi:hypothetical protein